MQADAMEVFGPQPCGDVDVDFVFHGVGLNLLVAIRTMRARSGADVHPYDS